jgi:hypothetical protein
MLCSAIYILSALSVCSVCLLCLLCCSVSVYLSVCSVCLSICCCSVSPFRPVLSICLCVSVCVCVCVCLSEHLSVRAIGGLWNGQSTVVVCLVLVGLSICQFAWVTLLHSSNVLACSTVYIYRVGSSVRGQTETPSFPIP